MPPTAPHTFHWTECAEFLATHGAGQAWDWDAEKGCMASQTHWLHLPMVTPLGAEQPCLEAYLAELPAELGRHCVILMQAGAVSIGLFEAGQALHTKTMKKYVVRGSGRAQPAHLKTKGKSRYGSRLRLQNAQLLLEEAAERLRDWWQLGVPIEKVFLSAPQRLWADFARLELPEPLLNRAEITRIPLDLPRPTTELLLRTYRALEHGRMVPRQAP